MTIAAIVGACILLFALAFLLPRLSWYPQRGVNRTLDAGQGAASTAPGKLGQLLQRPFSKGRRAVNRSASEGRRARSRLPG